MARCFSISCWIPRSARSSSESAPRARTRSFGVILHFDEPSIARLDDVHVDFGSRVVVVRQIQQGLPVDDADADGGDVVQERDALILLPFPERLERSASATNAPVIDAVRVPPSAWITSQSIQIVRSPSAGRLSPTAATGRSTAESPGCGRRPSLTLRAGSRARRPRQHPVLGGHPSFSGVAQELRDPVLDARRADDAGAAGLDEHRAFRMQEIVGRQLRVAKLVGRPVRSHLSASACWVTGLLRIIYCTFLASGRRRST